MELGSVSVFHLCMRVRNKGINKVMEYFIMAVVDYFKFVWIMERNTQETYLSLMFCVGHASLIAQWPCNWGNCVRWKAESSLLWGYQSECGCDLH